MDQTERPDIAREEVEAALETLLSRDEFLASRNQAQFLKFVVEETLAGRGDRLKAFTIATLALKRDASFDAQSNPIVRVQATRLRQLLESHYVGPGAADAIRIELPRGSYTPVFTRRGTPACDEGPVEATEEGESHVEPAAEPTPLRPSVQMAEPARLPRATRRTLLWIALTVCVTLFGFIAVHEIGEIILGRTGAGAVEPNLIAPIVVVQIADPSTQASAAAEAVHGVVNRIQNELSAFDNIVVRLPTTEGTSAESANYVLKAAALSAGEGEFDLSFRLVHQRTSEIVWSRSFPIGAPDDDARQKEIADTVAATIGDAYGVITSDTVRRLAQAAHTPPAYRCLLKAFDYLKSRDPDARPDIDSCLDKLLLIAGNNGRLLTLRSIVLVLGYLDATPDSGGVRDLERAVRLANRAYDLEPARARSIFGMFLARFYQKSYDDAFDAARKMLEANPNSASLKAVVAVARISRGDFAEGEAILAPILRLERNAPRAYLAFDGLAAYMRNDFETAWRIAGRRPQDHIAIGLLTKVLICQQRQDQDCAVSAAGQLRREFPAFASDIPASLDRYALADPIKARILDDLKTSGMMKDGSI
jgi:adenylate cyclase